MTLSAEKGPVSALGVDYAWGAPPAAADIAGRGYRVVARYLSHDPSKDLTPAELGGLLRAHEDVVVVWETAAYRALSGSPGGQADGVEMVGRLAQLQAPAWVAGYAAVDFPPAYSQLPTVLAYFDGFRAGLAGRRVGGYGCYAVIRALFDSGRIDLGWQTRAWSGTPPAVDPRACLYQNAQTVVIDGVQCDVDQVLRPDVGGWLSHPALSPMNPARKVRPMVIFRLPWNGNEWLVTLTSSGFATAHLNPMQAGALALAGVIPVNIDQDQAAAFGLH